jgi:hypothetical protein
MRSPEVAQAYRHFIDARNELADLLGRMAEHDQRLLAEMEG